MAYSEHLIHMSSRTKPSYDIKSQPILTPSQNYELEPDNVAPKSSYDLTRPTEGFPTDYVSRTYGGSFYGLSIIVGITLQITFI